MTKNQLSATYAPLAAWVRANWMRLSEGRPELRAMELARLIAMWPVHPRSPDSAKQLVYRFAQAGVFSIRIHQQTTLYSLAPYEEPAVPTPVPVAPPAPVVVPVAPPVQVVVPAAPRVPAVPVPVAQVPVPVPAVPVVQTEEAVMMNVLRQISTLMESAGLRKVVVEDGRMKYEKQIIVTRNFRL